MPWFWFAQAQTVSYGFQSPPQVMGTLLLLLPPCQVGKAAKIWGGAGGCWSHLVFMLELEVDKNEVP